MWTAITVLIIVFFAAGGVGFLTRLVEGRRKYLLDLKREEARVAEAKVREQELEHKRAELEYREALLEIERFDRRTPPPPDPPD
jgi:hypothetical protein